MIMIIKSLARQTWLEARYGLLPALLLALFSLGLGLRWFVQAIALLEPGTSALAIAAPVVRLLAVLLVCAIACNLICREFGERRIDLLLSAPVSHLSWIAGRMTGIGLISVAIAACASLALLNDDAPLAWLAWTGSLTMELLLIGALAVTISVALKKLVPSLLAVLLLYLASRLGGIIEMLAYSNIPGLAESKTAGWIASAMAALLPRLGDFAATEWLVSGAVEPALPQALAANGFQFLIVLTILVVVALMDMSRDLD